MRIIKAESLIEPVANLCIEACCKLPQDVRRALDNAITEELWKPARSILEKLKENYQIAEVENVPICQDTGMACVFLEIGRGVFLEGDFEEAVNEGIRQGYQRGYLRKSIVSDPLDRKNTGDNTPAMIYVDFVDGEQLKITLAPKGFGSENMSRIKMLKPSEGEQGIKDFVMDTVLEAGGNPCPPIVVGIGIGGNFDKAALMAKKALLRPVGAHHENPRYMKLEQELLEKINATGIGPQGFGGKTTALAVNILTLPTHIAGLPCAVNINCHVSRHQSLII